MGQNILGSLLMVLLLTCVLEILVALVMKIYAKKAYILILLVNLLTNPLVNVIYAVGISYRDSIPIGKMYAEMECFRHWTGYEPIWLFLEIGVWCLEGFIYSKFREWIPHPWRYALMANLVSALAGVFLA
ncbi:MAG: hypothetical protein Q4D32_04105 [Eubacteriales bacterium]|nr:hypothetical protein [Eubacteriales bacterium]